ncbi:MAG: DedA family protein, partial [Solirubrobacteraceae bacterium]|nr:DedA family protein [Solirubrobacteraceae bacterium]
MFSPFLSAYLTLASITDPIVDFAVNIVEKVGLFGIFIMMTLESACIPIPSEPTMMLAGKLSSDGEYPFIAVVLVGTIANVIGSWIGYAIGYFGRYEALEKHKWIHMDPKQIARTEQWFEKYGPITVFGTRLLPIVRTFISLPAGAARMPLLQFTIYTAAGCFIWMLGLTFLGYQLGENWEKVQEKMHYFDYVIAAVILGAIVYYGLRW